MANSLNDGLNKPDQLDRDLLQAGSFIASDVPVAVTFGLSFGAVPSVTLTPQASGTTQHLFFTSGAISTGSFMGVGQSGLVYSWQAIGSYTK